MISGFRGSLELGPGYQLCRELLTKKRMAWWDLPAGSPDEMWML